MENGDEHDSQMNAVFGIVVSTRQETPPSEVGTSVPTALFLELHPLTVSFSPARCVQHRHHFYHAGSPSMTPRLLIVQV
jgi:hypothetical protein